MIMITMHMGYCLGPTCFPGMARATLKVVDQSPRVGRKATLGLTLSPRPAEGMNTGAPPSTALAPQ
jgi:hypothetical protein